VEFITLMATRMPFIGRGWPLKHSQTSILRGRRRGGVEYRDWDRWLLLAPVRENTNLPVPLLKKGTSKC